MPISEQPILVTRSSMPSLEEYVNEIRELWDTHWLTNMGAKHRQLQDELKKYMQVPNIELLVNGHMALELTMQAMGLTGEVITTPFTFASTTHAIIRNGLTPVFCDINPDNYTIDCSKIEALITDRTSAIVPVHVYGNICNVEEIDKIAKKYGLKVIYDAAHTFGEKYKGVGVGNFGDASCFSFHATKVYNTIEGGAVTFADTKLGEKLYNLKNFGIHGPEHVESVGANAKMNEFQAAMGICNLRHIDEELKKRKVVTDTYRSLLGGVPGIKLNCLQEDVEQNYAYFPIFVDEEEYGHSRDELVDYLAEKGIYSRKYFYPLTSAHECHKGKFDAEKTSVAKKVSESVLTLPMYADLTMEIVERIAQTIMKYREK